MATKSTIIKNYRNKETLRLVELQEVADTIRKGEFLEQVDRFRYELLLMTYTHRGTDGSFDGYDGWPKTLPRICFALSRRTARASASPRVIQDWFCWK